jgi:peptidoglycan/xylan/chitin deacetylase (PgdA/CDA1 family)
MGRFFAYFSAQYFPFPAQTESVCSRKGGDTLKKNIRGWLLASAGILSIACALFSLSRSAVPTGGGLQLPLNGPPPMVAITFDDGPRDSTTTRLLDALALREVPATFFLVGTRIPGNEALIHRMKAEGHQIGVHSYSHIFLTALSAADFEFEVGQTRMQLSNILGNQPFWLRPPYGIVDESVQKRADSPIILWSVDPEDWKDHNTQRMVEVVLSKVSDGDIILFHDIYDSSVDAAIQVVDALLEQGYCFATAEQLLQAKGVSVKDGALYRRAK